MVLSSALADLPFFKLFFIILAAVVATVLLAFLGIVTARGAAWAREAGEKGAGDDHFQERLRAPGRWDEDADPGGWQHSGYHRRGMRGE